MHFSRDSKAEGYSVSKVVRHLCGQGEDGFEIDVSKSTRKIGGQHLDGFFIPFGGFIAIRLGGRMSRDLTVGMLG